MFSGDSYRRGMPNEAPPLRPADRDDVRQALAFAFTSDGRRRFQPSGEMMAWIAAEHRQ
jgi:hypothetical protein